jgi:hypothetical protein
MFAKFAGAQTLTGRIVLTQGAMNQSGQLVTEVQYERPSKLFIRQTKGTSSTSVTVASDGKLFTYPAPKLPWQSEGTRLFESVKVRDKTLTIGDIYSASGLSLIDRCAPLDIAIGRKEDLDFLRRQWATLEYKGTADRSGETVHVIMGSWRDYGNAPVTGQFRMLLSQDAELREYAVSEGVNIPDLGTRTTVMSVWDVKLQINGKPDPALFKVR